MPGPLSALLHLQTAGAALGKPGIYSRALEGGKQPLADLHGKIEVSLFIPKVPAIPQQAALLCVSSNPRTRPGNYVPDTDPQRLEVAGLMIDQFQGPGAVDRRQGLQLAPGLQKRQVFEQLESVRCDNRRRRGSSVQPGVLHPQGQHAVGSWLTTV